MSIYPENPPEWYWISGLHDAGIVGVESFEFPFDYNRFVGEKISLENRKTIWWLADRLIEQDNYYTLEMDLQDFDSFPEDFTFKIKFDRAEVKRKSS